MTVNNNIRNELWINKYKPVSLSEIIGNKDIIYKFKSWILNLEKHNCYSIILSGSLGIGKTMAIKLCLSELDYYIKIITPNELKDYRLTDNFNDYYNFINSIYSKISFTNIRKKNKIVIIFDDIENITLHNEKKYIINLYKFNNKFKQIPIIFISNNIHSKLLYDLKKNCFELIFNNPTDEELSNLIIKIYNNENIIIEDYSIIPIIIQFSQYDIRRLIYILEELSYHTENNILHLSIVKQVLENSQKKSVNIGLFNSTELLLFSKLKYQDILYYYEIEKVLLPLMIHENYKKKILYDSNLPFKKSMNKLINIGEALSKGDDIETYIYTDQNWYLQNIHGFYTCYIPSIICNTDDLSNKLFKIKFSKDLNKTSLKNINKKNINMLCKLINTKSTNEIIMLTCLCNYLIKNNMDLILIDILQHYNKQILLKDIELCLKIDKTINYTTVLGKDKKKFILSQSSVTI